ncbi:MAG: hypothetical protein ABWK00_06360 [Desulfurococcaceae archaeon]
MPRVRAGERVLEIQGLALTDFAELLRLLAARGEKLSVVTRPAQLVIRDGSSTKAVAIAQFSLLTREGLPGSLEVAYDEWVDYVSLDASRVLKIVGAVIEIAERGAPASGTSFDLGSASIHVTPFEVSECCGTVRLYYLTAPYYWALGRSSANAPEREPARDGNLILAQLSCGGMEELASVDFGQDKAVVRIHVPANCRGLAYRLYHWLLLDVLAFLAREKFVEV